MPAVQEKSVALVGAGRAARDWLETLVEFPELSLVAAIDPDAERLRGVPTRGFASVAAMLAAGCVPRAAILCAPPALHLELAEPLLRAGVDLLIEPPLATTPADADRIAALSERADRVAMTASRLRVAAPVAELRPELAAGAIGRLCGVEVALGAKSDARAAWRGDPALSGGGVWMELGPDALDLAEALAGPIQRLRIVAAASLQGGDVEDEVQVMTEHAAGLVGVLRLSWNEPALQPLLRCIGDRGEIALGSTRGVLRHENGDVRTVAGPFEPAAALASVLAEFLRECRRRERRVDGGAQTLAWLHAGYRSLASGRFELA